MRRQQISILTEPRNALTKQYRRLFEMEGAERAEFREEALVKVAHRAMKRKTGGGGGSAHHPGDGAAGYDVRPADAAKWGKVVVDDRHRGPVQAIRGISN